MYQEETIIFVAGPESKVAYYKLGEEGHSSTLLKESGTKQLYLWQQCCHG
jgi:hypothetical protein